MRTRYHWLKLLLVPLNAAAAAVLASGAERFPAWAIASATVVAAAGGALYALVNEVPHKDGGGGDRGA